MKTGHPGRMKDPTPEEIAEACRLIRATWSVEERRRRAGFLPTFVEFNPIIEGTRRKHAERFTI